jgi:N-acetyl-gamma-glutamyl-phosphate reductase
MSKKIRIAIVGATGYTGAELLRLLAGHAAAEVVAVTSRQEAGRLVADIFPNLRGHYDLRFSEPDMVKIAAMADVVFFATPHGTAMAGVPELMQRGVRVIDISADFRLRDAQVWERWYGLKHTAPDYLAQAVYGLPEMASPQISEAQLVACPGCYPTAVQLALLPLLRENLIEHEGIIADCKSGVSGAGRAVKLGSLFCETADNFYAYASAGHRHQPEIDQVLSDMAGAPVRSLFQPHLLPQIRGIHASVYAQLKNPAVDLQTLFEQAYVDAPFVDVMPAGSHPQTRSVRGANVARLAVSRRGSTVMVFCVIDNLVRGASGQAIHCMNLMFGLPQTQGLNAVALLP